MDLNYIKGTNPSWEAIILPAAPIKKEEIQLLDELKKDSTVEKFDQLDGQMAELIKIKHPKDNLKDGELAVMVKDFFKHQPREEYGCWVYYHWRRQLIRTLDEADFIQVRTSRNQYKITKEEQDLLSTKKIGVIGLSVGQSVALSLAMERSFGELRIADFDTLELSNMNRIRTGIYNLGLKKAWMVSREIAEIDPFLKVTIFEEGINDRNIDEFFEKDGALDLLVEECDSLDVKILAREKAREKGVPVVMDTSDRGMVDVERFDLEPKRPLLHGLAGNLKSEELNSLSNEEKVPFIGKMIGMETLSTRMKASFMEVGTSIGTWPQLASSVIHGGAVCADIVRKIFLDQFRDSGRYYFDFDEVLYHGQDQQSKTSEVHAPKSEKKQFIPQGELKSPKVLSKSTVLELVKKANLAPSGGNCQPWKWVFDKEGVLHLFYDKGLSESLLDYHGTGTLMALGAALENLVWTGHNMGLGVKINFNELEFEDDYIAKVTFSENIADGEDTQYDYLYPYIEKRVTNRKLEQGKEIASSILEELRNIAIDSGNGMEMLTDRGQFGELIEVLGVMDKIRVMNPRGYADFVREIRWTEKETIETRDGIDIETLELKNTGVAALTLLRDHEAISFLKKNQLGDGLKEMSKDTINASSAICLLTAKDFSPYSYLRGGKALQRVWTHINKEDVAFQPISASLFFFHRLQREGLKYFSTEEGEIIKDAQRRLRTLFNLSPDTNEVFLFRLTTASDVSIRSLRRDVLDTIAFL
ncbi:Rv1355c family protein [Echinicola marina]|uniref:Rv1355c family protein n=1 Tax=Echinicola marina TaxID=2859768 RepID=UPI001CF70D8E|nr:Rv1355c family protein [Echinicola marina]UCS95572.1 Rv1355c family protein [Echinicola marina]